MRKVKETINSMRRIRQLRENIEDGSIVEAEELINSGVDINARDIKGNTLLMVVCEIGSKDMARRLIEAKANVNARNILGETALIKACERGSAPIVDLLIKAKANVNARNIFGTTPLSSACDDAWSKDGIVKLLLEAKAKVNVKNILGGTPLMRACAVRNDYVVDLLIKAKADVNARSIFGATPLLSASRERRNGDIVKLLIEAKANVDARNIFGTTSLMNACAVKDKDMAMELIKAKININARDILGGAALMHTYKNEMREFIMELIELDSDHFKALAKSFKYIKNVEGYDIFNQALSKYLDSAGRDLSLLISRANVPSIEVNYEYLMKSCSKLTEIMDNLEKITKKSNMKSIKNEDIKRNFNKNIKKYEDEILEQVPNIIIASRNIKRIAKSRKGKEKVN